MLASILHQFCIIFLIQPDWDVISLNGQNYWQFFKSDSSDSLISLDIDSYENMSSENLAENLVAAKIALVKAAVLKMDDMNNSDVSFGMMPSGGVGDAPCLISNETPPRTLLELTSEQDLRVLASSEIDVVSSDSKLLKVSGTPFQKKDTSASCAESEQVDDDTTAGESEPEESRAAIAPEPDGTESEEYKDAPSLLKGLDFGKSWNPGIFSGEHENEEKCENVEKITMPGNNEEQLPEESQNENESYSASSSSSSPTRKQEGKHMPLPSSTATVKVKTNDDLWKERSRSRNRYPSPAWSLSRSRLSGCRSRNLVGRDEQENQMRFAAQHMHQSLKLLQKAIHSSDFCFYEGLPETATDEDENTTFFMPEFQQIMESGNEIEILENVMNLLGNSKENIGQYLRSTSEELAPRNQIKPFICPSCQSELNVELNTYPPQNPILPRVHTILEEQKMLTISSYYNTHLTRRTLIQTVPCDGLCYKIQFAVAEPRGPIQGIQFAKREYMGLPSPLSLDMLLSTIHQCASYVDTRIACSCVWNQECQHFLLAVIEKYLNNDYRPSTKMTQWHIYKLAKRLKKLNTLAGILSKLCDGLVGSVSKILFCMQKGMLLLDKSLKHPGLSGFTPSRSMDFTIVWDEVNKVGGVDFNKYNRVCRDEIERSQSVELLYRKLKSKMDMEKESSLQNISEEQDEDENISVEALMEIIALAANDIISMCNLAQDYASNAVMLGRNGHRVMRFMNATIAQLRGTQDIDMGALIATFLSSVEKLSMFEDFICERKVEIRSGIHNIGGKIIRRLCQLRSHMWMQADWSRNLAENSSMKIKEVNEVKRLWNLKKNIKDEIENHLQGIRGSDENLRLSVY